MTNVLDLFLAYPHGLIVTGTVLLILGLIGLALFSPRDVDGTEDTPEAFNDNLTKAEASKLIDQMRGKAGVG